MTSQVRSIRAVPFGDVNDTLFLVHDTIEGTCVIVDIANKRLGLLYHRDKIFFAFVSNCNKLLPNDLVTINLS